MGLSTRLIFHGLAAITVMLVMIPCPGTAHCPATWEHFQGDCYKIFPHFKSLVGYINYCRKFGAKVLEIKSAAENDFITRYLKTFWDKTGYVWLGVVYQAGQWTYLSNSEKITYTHWARGQPDRRYNSFKGLEDCIILGFDGAWYDVWCYWYPRYGICRMQC